MRTLEDILKNISNKNMLNESKADEQKLIDFAGNSLAKRFLNIKQRLKSPENDIYYWLKKSPEDLENKVNEIELTLSNTKQKQADKSEGAELVVEGNGYKVYRIDTYEASCLYGKGTKWCTASADTRKHFDNYTKEQGVIFYYFIKQDKKYAVALFPKIITKETGIRLNFELYDDEDTLLNATPKEFKKVMAELPKIPGVKLVYEFLPAKIENGVLKKVYPHNSGEFIIPNSVTSIGNSAFRFCFSLTNIIIPNSVTSIGSFAFSGCESLTSIVIPDSVTSIGEFAFDECSSLTNIIISNNVTSIGQFAFYYCDNLTSITIPNNVTSIGNSAFSFCKSLTSITISNNVTSIGNYAFSSCRSLTNINIPNSVTSIGDFAFNYCKSLTSITIPNRVSSIGEFAFAFCSKLANINIPNSVTSIGNSAFYDCKSLTSITIPNSVTSIDDFAFSYCNKLTIYVEAETKPEGWGNRWNYDNRPVIWNYKQKSNNNIGENTSLKTFLDVINESKADEQKLIDFAGNSLAKRFLNIKQRLKSPENDIYYWLKKSPDDLENKVNEIENTLSKTKERDVSKKEGAELVAEGNGYKVYRIDTYEASCLYGKGTKWCTASTDTRKHFDDYKKDGVVLYYIISDNKKYAVALYPEIVDASIEYGIKTNFELYDERDTLLNDKPEEFKKVMAELPKIPGVKLVSEFSPTEIENGVLKKVYAYNSGEFIIPNSVTSIGNDAFFECSSLTSIVIPNSVTSMGEGAFFGCNSLTNINIPNSVTNIGNSAFKYCSNLTNINIPNSVKSIGDYVFSRCTSLTSITIPNSVTSIGEGAFDFCSNLTNITVPNSITSISNNAFYNCTSLTSVTIPNSVTNIGDSAFANCDNLTSIIIPNSVTSIEGYVFYNCSSLTSITIPNSVKSIGDSTFRRCKSLTNINIPNSVTNIGDSAFSYCSNLTNINIPNSVTNIIQYAFSYCKSLTNINIPNSVTSICEGAFSDCTNLTSITIPASVTNIGNFAFSYCSKLTIYVEAESKPAGWSDNWNFSNRPVIWNYKQKSTKNIGERKNMLKKTFLNVLKESKADEQKLIDFAANSLAKRFLNIKQRLKSPENDIYYWLKKSPEDLENKVNEIELTLSNTKQKQADKSEGAELVAEGNGYKVYKINSYEASCLYGKGTKWCTAAKNSEYFDDYKKDGIVLYYIISDNKKYAIALHPEIVDTLQEAGVKANFELFDEKDNAIINKKKLAKVLNKFPKIPNVELIFEFLPFEIEDKVLIKVYPHSSGEFIIPDGVTSISHYAFFKCYYLTSVTIPNSVTSIGDSAFRSCYSLTNIVIPNSVTSIGDYAFAGCENLTNITIPSSVKSIEDHAFFWCKSLTNITIPNSVTNIGDNAFYKCTSLTIYAEASSQPNSWNNNWNPDNIPVVWNYKQTSTKNIRERKNMLKTPFLNVLNESQSQEIKDTYRKLSKLYGVDLDELIYGPDGFMESHYPTGFDVPADIIYLKDKWEEFENWIKKTKGIDFKAIRQKENANRVKEDIDYEKLKKQIDNQPITPIKKANIWNPDFYLQKEPGYEEMKRELVKLLQSANLVPTNIELSTFGSKIEYDKKNIKILKDAITYNLNHLLKKINNSLSVENVRCYGGKVTFDIIGYEYLKKHLSEENNANKTTFQITKNSKEFNNVVHAYYQKFGKHLQIDNMLYDNQSGKYYMFNDQTDYTLTTKRLLESKLEEEIIDETYSQEELDDMVGKVYNIQKIDKIYRRKKYDDKRLFAHTTCTKCGREKNVFLSNLINDSDKYGSCICSDTNIEAKIDNIEDLYSGHKKLSNNTSGYTGVSFVKTYKGEPYNKWRAYIEVDGVRTYLGDFTSKAKAIKARKEAGEKGIKWYKENRNKLMRDVRRRSKKYKTSKYRETQKTRAYAKVK